MMGVYYGFSDDSIIDFILEFDDVIDMSRQNIESRLFLRSMKNDDGSGTGYIRSFSEIGLDNETIIENINKKRYHNEPFPSDKLTKNPVQMVHDLFNTNMKYRYEVLRLLYKIYHLD